MLLMHHVLHLQLTRRLMDDLVHARLTLRELRQALLLTGGHYLQVAKHCTCVCSSVTVKCHKRGWQSVCQVGDHSVWCTVCGESNKEEKKV